MLPYGNSRYLSSQQHGVQIIWRIDIHALGQNKTKQKNKNDNKINK